MNLLLIILLSYAFLLTILINRTLLANQAWYIISEHANYNQN
jgi:hypothetical protein